VAVCEEILKMNFCNEADVSERKFMYDQLCGEDNGDSFARILKDKIPYKIKIFMWLVENDAILTKDNMIKRRWVDDSTCQFYDERGNCKQFVL
jgi:hypothetical protein